ncbi:hypothetical protein HDU93_008619 [Gonapodya sp. JEL0774]|nr:hypothetical protein HDU93_008619 [Gonapodya sp. JEL0774]
MLQSPTLHLYYPRSTSATNSEASSQPSEFPVFRAEGAGEVGTSQATLVELEGIPEESESPKKNEWRGNGTNARWRKNSDAGEADILGSNNTKLDVPPQIISSNTASDLRTLCFLIRNSITEWRQSFEIESSELRELLGKDEWSEDDRVSKIEKQIEGTLDLSLIIMGKPTKSQKTEAVVTAAPAKPAETPKSQQPQNLDKAPTVKFSKMAPDLYLYSQQSSDSDQSVIMKQNSSRPTMLMSELDVASSNGSSGGISTMDDREALLLLLNRHSLC